jgi:hypothetical protein
LGQGVGEFKEVLQRLSAGLGSGTDPLLDVRWLEVADGRPGGAIHGLANVATEKFAPVEPR